MREFLTTGKILRIDLVNNKITIEPTSKYEKKYIGGRGIDARIIYDAVGPETDPLDPGNLLIFSVGPFVGTFFPSSGKTHVRAKSPINGLLGSTNIGGVWGPEVKYAGYDMIVVEGKSEKPTYVTVDNEKVEIRDASAIWGKDIFQTQVMIKEELRDQDTKVICIGSAGENLVRYATVTAGVDSVGGRTGMGAVMGSKNLKGIAVRGTNGIKVAEPEKFFDLCKEAHRLIMGAEFRQEIAEVGLTRELDRYPAEGVAAYKNWQSTTPPNLKAISNEVFLKQYLFNKQACFGCDMACREIYKVPGLGGGVIKCAQYNSLSAIVSNDDMGLWYEATMLCQRGGLDVVQVAGLIAWFMELYQRGIITEKDTDGIPMEWGSRRAIIGIIEKIIKREGVGDLLADNYDTISHQIGKESEDYFIHTKGLAHEVGDLRPLKGTALANAVGPRGEAQKGLPGIEVFYLSAGLLEGNERKEGEKYCMARAKEITGTEKASIPSEYEGKAALIRYYEDDVTVADLLGYCKWIGPEVELPINAEYSAKVYSAGKGITVEAKTLLEAADRTRCLERAFEIREGITRNDDSLPKRCFEPVPDGPRKGESIDQAQFEKMKSEFYAVRGWDPETGIPTRQTLEKLGLKDIADDLEKGKWKLR